MSEYTVGRTKGISSLVTDTHRVVPFWDLDELDLKNARKALTKVQKENALGPIYIFQSRPGINEKGIHALSLDAMHWRLVKRILLSTWGRDVKHIRQLGLNGRQILRITNKGKIPAPKYVETLTPEFPPTWYGSRPHGAYLVKRGIPLENTEKQRNKWVGKPVIKTEDYTTRKLGVKGACHG